MWRSRRGPKRCSCNLLAPSFGARCRGCEWVQPSLFSVKKTVVVTHKECCVSPKRNKTLQGFESGVRGPFRLSRRHRTLSKGECKERDPGESYSRGGNSTVIRDAPQRAPCPSEEGRGPRGSGCVKHSSQTKLHSRGEHAKSTGGKRGASRGRQPPSFAQSLVGSVERRDAKRWPATNGEVGDPCGSLKMSKIYVGEGQTTDSTRLTSTRVQSQRERKLGSGGGKALHPALLKL